MSVFDENHHQVSATTAELEAILRALPHCSCGGLAEVTLQERPRCVGCAAADPHGHCVPLPHASLALRIEDVLLPFLPRGRR